MTDLIDLFKQLIFTYRAWRQNRDQQFAASVAAATAIQLQPQLTNVQNTLNSFRLETKQNMDSLSQQVARAEQDIQFEQQVETQILTLVEQDNTDIETLKNGAPGDPAFDAALTNMESTNTAFSAIANVKSVTISGFSSTAAVGSPAQQGAAVANDGTGNALSPQPPITWGGTFGSGGSITPAGLYTPGTSAGTDTITATSGAIVEPFTVTVS